jgi:hypothetical protein
LPRPPPFSDVHVLSLHEFPLDVDAGAAVVELVGCEVEVDVDESVVLPELVVVPALVVVPVVVPVGGGALQSELMRASTHLPNILF